MYQYSVFRCPKCKQAIMASSTSCKYCGSAVDVKAAHLGMLQEAIDHSRKQLKRHRIIFWAAGVGFLSGSVLTVLSYISAEKGYTTHFVLCWGLIGVGFVNMFYGAWSWVAEKAEIRSLNKEMKEFYDKFPYLKKSFI